MPKLFVNYSPALAELAAAGETLFDGIEVGPWFSLEKIKGLKKEYEHWPFQFHSSGYLSGYAGFSKKLKKLKTYHECTHSRWVTLHIELLPYYIFAAGWHLGVYLPPPNAEKRKKAFLRRLAEVKKNMDIPILLENMAALPGSKYAFAASPETISEMLQKSGCGLLLDLPHARVAAAYQGLEVKDYLQRLPLDKVKQIHVSGPELKNGILWDRHEIMQAEDYALLEWALKHSSPEILTLEYIREETALREQLSRLRQLISD